MAETYKLTYFNARGTAEPIRYILAVAGVDYEDIRVEGSNWPALKPKTRWGQVPFVQIGNQEIAQGATICRYLAKKFNLVGETDLEAMRADEIVDAVYDFRAIIRPILFEQDPAKKEELKKAFVENQGKFILTKFAGLKDANGGKWIVGKNMTWADIYLAHILESVQVVDADFLKTFPSIEALLKNVLNVPQIKTWIAKRPKTPM